MKRKYLQKWNWNEIIQNENETETRKCKTEWNRFISILVRELNMLTTRAHVAQCHPRHPVGQMGLSHIEYQMVLECGV